MTSPNKRRLVVRFLVADGAHYDQGRTGRSPAVGAGRGGFRPPADNARERRYRQRRHLGADAHRRRQRRGHRAAAEPGVQALRGKIGAGSAGPGWWPWCGPPAAGPGWRCSRLCARRCVLRRGARTWGPQQQPPRLAGPIRLSQGTAAAPAHGRPCPCSAAFAPASPWELRPRPGSCLALRRTGQLTRPVVSEFGPRLLADETGLLAKLRRAAETFTAVPPLYKVQLPNSGIPDTRTSSGGTKTRR